MPKQQIDELAVIELKLAEKLGECPRRKVAAVMVSANGEVLSTGYNALASPGGCHCPGRDVPAGQGGECYAVHAEMRALTGLECSPALVAAIYTTKAMCSNCVRTFLSLPNCKTAFFITPSNETANRDLWEAAGRVWEQINA